MSEMDDYAGGYAEADAAGYGDDAAGYGEAAGAQGFGGAENFSNVVELPTSDVDADTAHMNENINKALHIMDDLPSTVHGIVDGHAGHIDAEHMAPESHEHKLAYAQGYVTGEHAERAAHLLDPAAPLHVTPPDPHDHHGPTMGPNTMTPDEERRGREIGEWKQELNRVLRGEGDDEPHTHNEAPKWAQPSGRNDPPPLPPEID